MNLSSSLLFALLLLASTSFADENSKEANEGHAYFIENEKLLTQMVTEYFEYIESKPKEELIDVTETKLYQHFSEDLKKKHQKRHEHFQLAFKLRDQAIDQGVELVGKHLLSPKNIPRDILFRTNAILPTKMTFKETKVSGTGTGIVLAELLYSGDQNQKIWQDENFQVTLFFYLSKEKKWVFHEILFQNVNDEGDFWTLTNYLNTIEDKFWGDILDEWQAELANINE